jgi:hypothetical protein
MLRMAKTGEKESHKVKVKITLEHATKAQVGSIVLLFV